MRIQHLIFLALIVASLAQNPAPALPSAISSYLMPFSFIGNNNNNFVYEYRTNGAYITTLQVWYTTGTGGTIVSFRAFYSDGTWTMQRGPQSGSMAQINLAQGEVITQLLLWPDNSWVRLARIEMATSAGQNLQVGRDPNTAWGMAFLGVNVGSGLLAGFGCSTGAAMDGGGLLFYRPIVSLSLNNFTYLNAPNEGDTWGFSPMSINEVSFTPPPNQTSLAWSFAGKASRSESHTWDSTVTTSYGVKASISGEFFFLKFSVSASWSRKSVVKSSSAISTQLDLTYQMGGTAYANQSGIILPFKCVAQVYTASLDLNYNALLQIVFDNNATLTAPTKGSYSNVVYTRVDSSCVPI